MNSERNIVNKLFEGKYKELEEAKFKANGSTYRCIFGHYTKDGKPISREEYFRAKGEDVKGSSPAPKKGGNGGGSGDGEGPKKSTESAYTLAKKFLDNDKEVQTVDDFFSDLLANPGDYGYEDEDSIEDLKNELAYVKKNLGDDAIVLSEDGNNVSDFEGFHDFLDQCKSVDNVSVSTGVSRHTLQHPSGAKIVKANNWGYEIWYASNPNKRDPEHAGPTVTTSSLEAMTKSLKNAKVNKYNNYDEITTEGGADPKFMSNLSKAMNTAGYEVEDYESAEDSKDGYEMFKFVNKNKPEGQRAIKVYRGADENDLNIIIDKKGYLD